MTQNLMEELTSQLSQITLDGAETREDPNFQDIIEAICCNNKKRVECHDHFLNNTLMYNLHENLKSKDKNTVYSTLCFIAVLSKYDVGREYLSNIYLVVLILDRMRQEMNYNIRVQSCRALANMCYEHARTQRLIVGQDALEPIFFLMETSTMPNMKENNPKFKQVIVGLVLNLIADNAAIQEEVAQREVPTLVRSLEDDLKNETPSVVSQNVFVILATLTEVKPPEIIFSSALCSLVVEMYRRTPAVDYAIPGLEFLQDGELPDITKCFFAEAGIFDVFMNVMENKPDGMTEEQGKKYDLVGRALANILSGDEAMEHVYEINDGEILNRFATWLSSEDKDLIHTAALCIANIARTDTHSVIVVQRGIHKSLLDIVKNNMNDVKILYATVSALRNLCVPRPNKMHLVGDGILEALLPLLNLEVKPSSPVIFKMVGALRQLIDGQEDVTVQLGSNPDLVTQLVRWSSSSLLPWVSSESSRFLCWLVNISKDRNVIINIIENGGYVQMVRMLGALHGVMQSEALTSLTISASAALLEADRIESLPDEEKEKSSKLVNFDSVLIECNLGERLKHLIVHHGAKMDHLVLDDLFNFLEEILKFKRIRCHLRCEGVKVVFHYVMRSRSDFEMFKNRTESIENSFTSN